MSRSTGSVLVVEDDPDVRESLVELLEDSGRKVVAAENGAVALSKLATPPCPCLIVLDLVMPEMNGFEFLEHLKARPDAQVFPVLIVSANAFLEQAELYPGVLGTLTKPFSAGDLLVWVEQYCPL